MTRWDATKGSVVGCQKEVTHGEANLLVLFCLPFIWHDDDDDDDDDGYIYNGD